MDSEGTDTIKPNKKLKLTPATSSHNFAENEEMTFQINIANDSKLRT